jgi:hypothetical protein
MAMLEVSGKNDTVKKVTMTLLDDAADQLDNVYLKCESIMASKVECGRVDQQLIVRQMLIATALDIRKSMNKPNSKLMRIVRKADGNDGVRKSFMTLLCAGLSQNGLGRCLTTITQNGLSQSDWLDMVLNTLKENVKKKGALFPYITTEEADGAILLITAGINTFVLCTLDPREKSVNWCVRCVCCSSYLRV